MAQRQDLLAQVAGNKRRTVYLMAGFTLLITGVVAVFDLAFAAGPAFIAIAIIIVLAMVWASYFYSDKLANAAAHAREADPDQYHQLHNIVEELCLGVGLPKPRIYIVDDAAPNAFATGRNPTHAALAVTSGLLEIMERTELEGVVAHELSHIHNYDILVATIAVTLVGFVALLSDFGLRMLLFGGRRRDNEGGTGIYILALSLAFIILAPIAALEKLRDNTTIIAHAPAATAHMWIESPLDKQSKGAHGWFNRLFETHPPIEARIAALQEVAGTNPPAT